MGLPEEHGATMRAETKISARLAADGRQQDEDKQGILEMLNLED